MFHGEKTLCTCPSAQCIRPCPADIYPHTDPKGNGVVNVDDLLTVINEWGPCGGCCTGDIVPQSPDPAVTPHGDGVINVDDLLMVINAWGDCP